MPSMICEMEAIEFLLKYETFFHSIDEVFIATVFVISALLISSYHVQDLIFASTF